MNLLRNDAKGQLNESTFVRVKI